MGNRLEQCRVGRHQDCPDTRRDTRVCACPCHLSAGMPGALSWRPAIRPACQLMARPLLALTS